MPVIGLILHCRKIILCKNRQREKLLQQLAVVYSSILVYYKFTVQDDLGISYEHVRASGSYTSVVQVEAIERELGPGPEPRDKHYALCPDGAHRGSKCTRGGRRSGARRSGAARTRGAAAPRSPPRRAAGSATRAAPPARAARARCSPPRPPPASTPAVVATCANDHDNKRDPTLGTKHSSKHPNFVFMLDIASYKHIRFV